MNLYAFLPLSAFLTNIALGGFILFKNFNSKLNRIFALATLALAIWSLGFFYSFTSISPELALFWNKTSNLGVLFTSAFLLHFILAFTKNNFITKKINTILIYLPVLILISIDYTTNLISVSSIVSWWGWSAIQGPFFIPFSLYITSTNIISIYLSYKFYLRTKISNEKIQTKLFTISITIPLICGVITELIPGILGLEIIPISIILATLTAIIIVYALTKYRFITITTAVAADNIIATMEDYILVADQNKNIALINYSFKKALGIKKKKLVGESLDIINFNSKKLFTELEPSGHVHNYETEFFDSKKRPIPISINASIMKSKSKKILAYILVMRDISSTKKLIADLKEKSSELEKSNMEVEKNIKELETFKNIAVSRELKMIKIKDKIKQFTLKK